MEYRPAQTLREIREICNPHPLAGQELETLFVVTDEARDPDEHMREALRSILDGGQEDQRILVYGHRGCGKSTELARLMADLGGGWLAVAFSILKELPATGIHAEDILLSIAVQLVEKAHSEGLKVDDAGLQLVRDFFHSVTVSSKDSRASEMTMGAEAGASTPGIFGSIIKLAATFRSELKVGTRREESVVENVRKRPGDLVAALNSLINSIRAALGERRLLIVVEDLDKLSLADARSVFIENAQLLASPIVNLIYTIPIFTFHSPEAGAIHAQFDHERSFPMLKVRDERGEPGKGVAVIEKIIQRRIADGKIAPEARALLIEKTGGVLRHVFQVLHTAASMTSLKEPPIRVEHIEYGLRRLKRQLGIEITLPEREVPGISTVEDLYAKLVEYGKRQDEKRPLPPTADPAIQPLLQCGALIEYNGVGWLGVHPLVRELLQELGYPRPAPPVSGG